MPVILFIIVITRLFFWILVRIRMVVLSLLLCDFGSFFQELCTKFHEVGGTKLEFSEENKTFPK